MEQVSGLNAWTRVTHSHLDRVSERPALDRDLAAGGRMAQRIVDEGIAQFDMAIVINTGLLMLGYALIGVVGGIGGGVFTELATQGFGADLRSGLFRKTQSLSFGNLDELLKIADKQLVRS